MSNKLRILYNYNKYKNVNRFKTREDVTNYQKKEVGKLNEYINENSKNTDSLNNSKEQNEKDIRTGIVLARLFPQRSNNLRIAIFQRSDNNLFENIESRKIKVTDFDVSESIENQLSLLSQLQPNILIAPPSTLLMLADAIYNKRLSIDPIKVISVEEVLEDRDRDYFIKQFKVTVIDQIYQSDELFLGYTCEYGTLHLNEDVLIFEEEKIDEHKFFPIITDFTMRSKLVSRYRLNDILVHKKESCPCGCQFMALEKIEGSEVDVFTFTKGDGCQMKLYPDTIRSSVLNVEGIKNYEVIQISEKSIQLNLEYDQTNMFAVSQKKLIQQKLVEEFKKISEVFKIHEFEIVFDEYKHTMTKKMKRVRRG